MKTEEIVKINALGNKVLKHEFNGFVDRNYLFKVSEGYINDNKSVICNKEREEFICDITFISFIYNKILPMYLENKDLIDEVLIKHISIDNWKIVKIISEYFREIDIVLLQKALYDESTSPFERLNKFNQLKKHLRLPDVEILDVMNNIDGEPIEICKYYIPYESNNKIGITEIPDADRPLVGAIIHNPVSPNHNDAFIYGNWLWTQIMGFLNPDCTQAASDPDNGVLFMPADMASTHAANCCVNNTRYGIEMFGEKDANINMPKAEKSAAVLIKYISEHYNYANCADAVHQNVSQTGTECPKVSLDMHGNAQGVLDYINESIPGGYDILYEEYCDTHVIEYCNNPIIPPDIDDLKLTGYRYNIKGGNFLGDPYFGYDRPGGIQKIEFSCDEGWYWAEDLYYNGERWWFLCDDAYRFFYIPDVDVEFNQFMGNHIE